MAVARYQLGMMFLYAEGAEQDVSKARTWFEKAASQNQPDALYQPGVMYYRGKGCERGDVSPGTRRAGSLPVGKKSDRK